MGRLNNLDGLRGVAALGVLGMHATHLLGWRDPLPHAYLAVDFFFLLSGYIMGRTYQERLDRGGVSEFARARVIRLWPLLLLGTSFGACAAIVLGNVIGLPLSGLLGALCIPSLTGAALFALNGPQWSLFLEICANAGHAALGWRARRGVLAVAVAGFGIALLAVSATGHSLNGGFSPGTLWIGLLRVGFSYSLGLLLFRIGARGLRLPFVLPAGLMAMVFLAPESRHDAILEGATILALWPLLLLSALRDADEPPWIRATLARLGALSYPVYILHYPVLQVARHYEIALGLRALPTLAISGALIIALSLAASSGFDEPIRAILSRLGRSRFAPQPQTPAQ